jgi:hypothetical protein
MGERRRVLHATGHVQARTSSNPYAAWLVTTDERTRYAPNYEQYASDRWARLEWNLNLAST